MSKVFIVSAPSGSGKSTLVARLLASDKNFYFSISYTTRAPRGAEQNHVEYHFISRADFEARMGRGEFLEHAEVFGNYYGTHREILDLARAAGQDVLLDIDVQGARQLKEKIPDAVSIFILAPSRAELEKRLRAREENSEEEIQRRLAGAAREIEDFRRYDYVLVNEEVDAAADALCAIVKAERLKLSPGDVEARIGAILRTFRPGANSEE
jgi:guanylate kinase